MYPFGTLTWFYLLGSLGRALCSLAVGLALGMAQSPLHRVGPQKCLRITFDTIPTSRLVESATSRRRSARCSLWAQTTSSLRRTTRSRICAPRPRSCAAPRSGRTTARRSRYHPAAAPFAGAGALRTFDELTDAGHLLRCMSPDVARSRSSKWRRPLPRVERTRGRGGRDFCF